MKLTCGGLQLKVTLKKVRGVGKRGPDKKPRKSRLAFFNDPEFETYVHGINNEKALDGI